MNPERRQFHSERLLKLANDKGTEKQIDDMSYAVSMLSKYDRELSDIKSGIRKQEDHPHHDVKNLRLALRGTWQMIKLVEQQINTGDSTPSWHKPKQRLQHQVGE